MVIKQVAEAKCPDCAPSCPFSGGECYCHPTPHCAGTGLRWPTLSRECPFIRSDEQISQILRERPDFLYGMHDGGLHAFSRYRDLSGTNLASDSTCYPHCKIVPDVTLEKVHRIAYDSGWEIKYERTSSWRNREGDLVQGITCWIGYDDRCLVTRGIGLGVTDQEAACAALLATTPPVTSPE